jgi:CHAT domain-containing protein
VKIARELNSYREIFNALSILAKLNFGNNNYVEAKANLDEIYKTTADCQEKAITIQKNWLMGKYYLHMKDYASAEKYLQTSIRISKQIGSTKYLWEPLYCLASLLKETGKIDSAINTLKETIIVIETIKNKVAGGAEAQKLFASGNTKVVVYSDIVELLMQQGRIEEALQYLERGNSENLKTKFRGLNVAFNDPKKNDALSKEKELKNKLDLSDDQIVKEKSKPQAEQNEQLIKKLEEIKTIHQVEYISFVNQVVTQEPSLKNYFSKSENPINFRAQRKNIPADMAVLLYLFSNDNLYIFAGTSDSVVAKVIKIDKPALEKKIADFCISLKTPSFSAAVRGAQILDTDNSDAASGMETFKNNSADLYNILIRPVEDVIQGKAKLAIIPNGSLYYIPFQVLGQQTDKGFQYLISDYSVFYSNKLSYLFDNLFQQDNSPKILAIGNADKTLPFAEEEVKGLKTIFTGSKILLQEEATKSAVLSNQGGYTIIHFATHGILDYNNFEKSYLVLAKDAATGDDGKFKIDDIYGINNLDKCEMVTLSACETAVTLESSQGWPITTASAFLEIGVPTVIASLWSVDDKATGILMNKFYENLKTMNKLEALRSAQKSLLADSKFNHPYYWAPFLLVGNWK